MADQVIYQSITDINDVLRALKSQLPPSLSADEKFVEMAVMSLKHLRNHTPYELSKVAGIDHGTLWVIIDAAMKAGLVKKAEDPFRFRAKPRIISIIYSTIELASLADRNR